MRSVIYMAVVLALTACATNVTMTGKQYPAVAPSDVKILFRDRPSCRYEELGFISTPPMWNQNMAIESAREKAAAIGADYLLIENVSKNHYNDATVSAMAYKCAKVERKKVELKPK